MISLEETRELLGRLAVGKTDQELAVIRENGYATMRGLMHAFELRQRSRFVGISDAAKKQRPSVVKDRRGLRKVG